MADLTARFRLIDEMSDKLAGMAEGGQNALERWEQAGDALEAAFDGAASGTVQAASAVDGVATSIENLQQQTDNWTEAVGNYDKGLLEAIYTTEELVEQGFKTADALEEQGRMFELCEQAASHLSKSLEATVDIQNELSSAMDAAAEATEKLSASEDVSAETKATLAKASEGAAEAMSNLTAAQEEAAAAMEEYDRVMTSGTNDLNELETAAARAGTAAEALAEANGKATAATEELSKATEKASEEAESGGKKAVDAVEGIASALAAAGITAAIKEITESAYELVTVFSDAESTVVKATGASGAALDGLTESMMNAYAASKSGDLGNTAGAIGEINTRMALTEEALTTVTGQFLDFSEITGTNVVGSVQSATKIMNKWGVDAENVGGVLDKLAYAGQISGISVDSLSSTVTNSSATFQALDLNLDNAIGLLADLELYGTSSQTTVTGLRTAVNNFTKDGLDAGDALRNVIEEIANMEDASAATALAVETFGSRAGQELSGAIRSGAISVDSLTQSLEVANGTVEKTAATAQTLDQKWTQASNNINAAFTTAIQPTVDGISSGFAGVANSFGTFLNEHPKVTKAIVAIGVGLGVVVAGVAGVTFVTTVAIPAVAAFGVALNAALGPIGWVAIGITAVVAAGAALIAMFKGAEDETAGMTAATRAQYYELQDLNAEYEEACEKYGETSEEALRLKYEVDDLSAAFEANRQTVEEFTAEVDALCSSVSEVSAAFNDGMAAIRSNEVGSLALIQKYEDLATKTDLTAAQEKQLEAVTQQLTQSYPELAAQLDGATMSTEEFVDAMRRSCEQQAEEARQQQAQETYVEALQKRAELTDELAKAQENLNLEQARLDGMNGWDRFWAGTDDLDAYQEALDNLNAAMAENDATIAQIEQGWADIAEAEAAAAEETVSWQEAVSTAYSDVKARVDELCAAYDEAYQSALESFEGQFGLFDEASTKSEEYVNSTVENAQAALESQLAYWGSYLANVETLKAVSAEGLGITQENYEALMAYAQDGSEQAAGLAASMADAIQRGDADAVAALANTVGEVSARQQEVAEATADWVTDFTGQMDEIEQEMQATVEGMNLSDEAAASATATITAYADQIRAGKGGAVAAAQEVSRAVSQALSTANTSVSVSTSVAAHANGTTNAENAFIAGEDGPELVARRAATYATGTTNSADYYIAGENGPELIIGEQGSTVFPTSETDRLIDALNADRRPFKILPGNEDRGDTQDTSSNAGGQTEQVKRIFLEIGGNGAIEITGGTDLETILGVLTDNLKPVLMNIIQGEIFEEGDGSYEY